MDEPVPARHRRRERRRNRPDEPTAAGTPREYAGDTAPPPAEPTPLDPTPAAGAPGAAEHADAPGQSAAGAPGRSAAGPHGTAGEPPSGPQGAGGVRRGKKVRRGDAERGLRGIVGAGPSQVGVLGAMRARDAARPTAADLAEAEREVVIVRRHYVPPDTLPRSRP